MTENLWSSLVICVILDSVFNTKRSVVLNENTSQKYDVLEIQHFVDEINSQELSVTLLFRESCVQERRANFVFTFT